MSHTPHDLAETFPDAAARIHDLKTHDSHFAKLADEYHALNRDIHRGETNIEPMDDARLEDLKKRRLLLLDEIARRLAQD